MSRFEFRGREPHLAIVVGWDVPLRRLFAQVWDERAENADPEEPFLWAGCWDREVQTVAQLEELLSPYAALPPDVRELLTRQTGERTK